ncbi:MAG TPA: hypothetical protein VFA07_00850 [Chthonomonadaceae bacterium]|nr:hypothetical protein [Chthonomonadaceae bacterium]
MSEQADLDKPDLRTDAQKFEDLMRAIVTVPKKAVDAKIAAEKAERKRRRAVKQK